MPRRYPDAIGVKKPMKSERSHEENQERAYIAASRRSDRSLEARVASARLASEIHKKRTGKGFKITEEIVSKEEMYEEEDDDIPLGIRGSLGILHTSSAHLNARMDAYVAKHMGMAQMARELEIGQQFEQHFPGFSSVNSRARMMQQQQQIQQQNQFQQGGQHRQQQPVPRHSRHLSYASQDMPTRDFSQSPISEQNQSQFNSPVPRATSLSEESCGPDESQIRRHTITSDGMITSPNLDSMRLMAYQRHNSNDSISSPGLTSGGQSPQTQLHSPELNVANPFLTTDSLRPMVPTAPIVNGNSVFTSQLPANVEQMLSGPWGNYNMTYRQSSCDPTQSPLSTTAHLGEQGMDQLPDWLQTDGDQKSHHDFLATTGMDANDCNNLYAAPVGMASMFPGDTSGNFNGVSADGLGDEMNYNIEEMDMDQYFNFESFNASIQTQAHS